LTPLLDPARACLFLELTSFALAKLDPSFVLSLTWMNY
jgi:hypothetical protein